MSWTQRRTDIAEFLTTRRAKITPEQAGLPTYGKRRVQGLRREEVASLAGISVEYYKRLERGNVTGVSELVLEGLARALQLDDAERAHLFDLARAANPVAPEAAPARQAAHPPGRAAHPRPDRRAGHRAQRPPGLPRRQRARPRALRAGVRQPRAARQQRPLHLPRSRRRRLLPRLGPRRLRACRSPALRGGSQPVRPPAVRPRRRAVDAQRRVPRPLGRAQRALPPHRHQAHPPSGRRRARPELRDDGPQRRRRPERRDLHRRARLGLPAGARPARQLDGDAQPPAR